MADAGSLICVQIFVRVAQKIIKKIGAVQYYRTPELHLCNVQLNKQPFIYYNYETLCKQRRYSGFRSC